ncbi:MAG: Ig-like domain-containing protein [Myxococcota bacterium]
MVRPEPPTASDDAVTTPEDHAVTVDVGVNDDDALEVVAIATPPTHGVATLDESGTITYTPSGDFHGSDSFAYRSCDAHDQCATATVTVSVTPVPDAPIANDDAASTPNATPVTLDLLANDTDPDGDALTVANVTNPAHGTVTLAGVYTPAEGFDGIDGFDYTACDASGLCDTAHATITVGQGVNHGPVGHDDTATVDEDGHATIDVIDNDVDPDGDNLDVTEVSDPDHGTAVIDADGNITYTPDPDYAGQDDFTYVVCDTEGACATVSVTITVTPENDAPVAIDDHATTPKDTPVTIAALANDFDPDGDPLSVDGVDLPTGMDLVTNADGTFTFTPAAGFVGTTSFRYVVADPGGLTDDAIVTIDVSDTTTPNHAPEAADDSATVATDGTVTVPVTANDQDADGDALVVTAVVQPEHGTVVIGEDGAVSYTPDPGFVGSDSFSYTVSDGHGGSDSATVTVTVVDDGTGFEGVVAEGGGGCAAGGLEPGWLAAAAALLAGLARRRRRV